MPGSFTGRATGEPTDPVEVEEVHARVGIPTLVGSGVTPDNVGPLARADALIVGSFLKFDGLWSNQVDPARCEAMARAFRDAGRTTDAGR